MSWFSHVRQRRPALLTLDEYAPTHAQTTTVAHPHSPDASASMLSWNAEEVKRLDFQHYLLRQAMSGNYRAPIKHTKFVLDVGCGTGRWAQEIAQAFPSATVIGLDIFDSPIEANISMRPSNYQFVSGDIFKGLPFSSYQFDFVHQRSLGCLIPTTGWHQVVNELVRVTRPGGIVELAEPDCIFHNPGPTCIQLQQWIIAAYQKCGIDPVESAHIDTYLLVAGLTHVKAETITLPVGHWAGRMGSTTATNMRAAYLAMKPLVLQHIGISSVDYDHLSEQVFEECEQYHSSVVWHVAYGQRPFQ